MISRNSNIAEFLLDGKEPSRLALQLTNRGHSYGELQSASVDVARYLLSAGGQKGDRVVLASDNSFFWVASYLGTLWSGLVCVPLPTTLPRQDFDYILETTGARFAFMQARVAAGSGSSCRRISLVTDLPVPNTTGPPGLSFTELRSTVSQIELTSPQANGDDLAALMFTSGSTGKPRGVMVSHANIMANTASIVEYLGLTERDRIMTVLPFHYCFGTSLLHTHLMAGGSLVIELGFMYPESILHRMIETECTGFAGVPSHFQILLRSSSLKKRSFPHLRYIQQAGGHLAPSLIRELREALPGTQVFVMYGQTEATARLSYLPPEFLETKLGSVGRGIPGVKLRVVNDSGDEVGPGEVGEIVAEGDNIAQGYWHASEESAASFGDGKLYTGDLATVDHDGFIYLVDRAKDFLKCGGKRISCRQIEERLLESEALLEAAVIGVPDDVLGEAVKVFVVPCKSASDGIEERVRLFCKKHIRHELAPKDIVVLTQLPKNSAGKVLKQELKNL